MHLPLRPSIDKASLELVIVVASSPEEWAGMKRSLILVGRDLAKAEGYGYPPEIELYKQT